MAFENKTIEQIEALIIAGLEAELNTKFRLLPKAFIRILAKVFAGVYITLYKQQGWIFLQLFVDYATFDSVYVLGRTIRPLVEWGRLVGAGEPGDSSPWKGSVTVTKVGKVETYLNSGAQLKSTVTGQIYITTETKLLANSTEVIQIQCIKSGKIGNIATDDELQFINPLANVEKKARVFAVETKGGDAETEETYRSRVRQRWQVQVQGGALSDYRNWAAEVEGVYETYIYSDKESPTSVLIYVAADPAVNSSRIVPKGVLLQVGDACTYDPITKHASRKPVGAVLDPAFDGTYSNVKNVSVTNFNVYITGFSGGDVADFIVQVKSNLELYFFQREPFVKGLSVDNTRSDVIKVNNLIGVVDEITSNMDTHFLTVTLEKAEAIITEYTLEKAEAIKTEYTLGFGELANLGKLHVNGVHVNKEEVPV